MTIDRQKHVHLSREDMRGLLDQLKGIELKELIELLVERADDETEKLIIHELSTSSEGLYFQVIERLDDMLDNDEMRNAWEEVKQIKEMLSGTNLKKGATNGK